MATLSEEQLSERLFLLMSDAAETYKEEVVSGKKSYTRFVADFVDLRYEVDGDAVWRNAHRRNINVVHGLLVGQQEKVLALLAADELDVNEFQEVVKAYNTLSMPPTMPLHPNRSPISLSLGFAMDSEQIALILRIAKESNLFLVSDLSESHIERLLNCEPGFQLRADYVRGIVLLFQRLAHNDIIIPDWQTVLARGEFILSKTDGHPLKANTFSSSLGKAGASRSMRIEKVKACIDKYIPKKPIGSSEKKDWKG